MTPILKSIAQAYRERYSDLSTVCFIFPNKRSATIFRNHLMEMGLNDSCLPKLWTINSFISIIAKKQEASRLEQLFTLYNCYKKLVKEENQSVENIEIDFDLFRNWGETVISDFNTVDQNLVSPEEIFKNVTDLRNLSTNFLNEDQQEVMKEYFGRIDYQDPSVFWINFFKNDKLSESKQKFINLWQILGPLHKLFTEELAKKEKASSGGMYRLAYENISEKGRGALGFKKIVIVGFNALNGAEREIFKKLKSFQGHEGFDNFTDFIWDATGPLLNRPKLSCSKFISYNKRKFPTPEWLESKLKDSESKELPKISIISSPAYTSQLKIAGEILTRIAKNNNENNFDNAETVLVLPDESLLSNTLYSLPQEVKNVNLTMGYSFRNTAVASFMGILRRNYKNFKVVKGVPTFFVSDLKILLSHPFSYLIFGGENLEKLLDFVNRNHKITITINEIKWVIGSETFLFDFPDKKENAEKMFRYVENVLTNIQNIIKDEEIDTDNVSPLELDHIRVYREYLTKLEKNVNEYQIPISTLGVLLMADKLISSEKIGFEGEPLTGLQIMGTLETRLLDFKNIIVVSMNEGIMPKKSRTKSFIPETIRKGFGLPPSHYSEEIFAYYFFRLISRAENVHLIYDGREGNGNRGTESRYILQLKQLVPNEKLNFENWTFLLESPETETINIEKNSQVKEKLQPFISGGKLKRNLSASTLSTYRECQIKFYFRHVLNINPDPQPDNFIDAISIGNILHDVMMNLYVSKENQGKLLENPVIIDKDKIQGLLKNEDLLKSLIKSSIKQKFYQKADDDGLKNLSTTSEMVAENILTQVKQILQHDLELAPFKIWGCEISEVWELEVSDNRKVNFRFAIDRLDEQIENNPDNSLRIVDYKTGKSHLLAENIEDVITGGNNSKHIFQLFTYAWLLSKKDFAKGKRILTEIYQVPDIVSKPNSGIPEIGKNKIKAYNDPEEDYSIDFETGIKRLINEIFDSTHFNYPEDKDACIYCPFKSICH